MGRGTRTEGIRYRKCGSGFSSVQAFSISTNPEERKKSERERERERASLPLNLTTLRNVQGNVSRAEPRGARAGNRSALQGNAIDCSERGRAGRAGQLNVLRGGVKMVYAFCFCSLDLFLFPSSFFCLFSLDTRAPGLKYNVKYFFCTKIKALYTYSYSYFSIVPRYIRWFIIVLMYMYKWWTCRSDVWSVCLTVFLSFYLLRLVPLSLVQPFSLSCCLCL